MKFLGKVLFVFSFLFFSFSKPVLAENEFIVDSKVEYSVSESGKTLVTHEVNLENAFSTLYATSYSLSLENIDSQNVTARYENGTNLSVETQKEDDETNI